ncbi:NTP transferase domain-containing protein [Candidatus Daviesbacteria bacterium]|nr:NTP transferase domain-containing protein [Candidatus Daviesbacteria bacterium]
MNNFSKVAAVILAAGKGTRMQSNLPKVLFTVNKKPIAAYILATLQKLQLEQIKIVVGYQDDKVRQALGKNRDYINQGELLGTGHAVLQALPYISKDITTIMVLNGDDSIFYKPQTVTEIINEHSSSKKKVTILTSIQKYAEVSGRVIRDKSGKIIDIKANSIMTKEELEKNHEVVCGLYLFDRNWLEKNLPKVEKSKSGEYHITTLIYGALSQKVLQDIKLANKDEWRSINSQNELKNARKLWSKLYGNHRKT